MYDNITFLNIFWLMFVWIWKMCLHKQYMLYVYAELLEYLIGSFNLGTSKNKTKQ